MVKKLFLMLSVSVDELLSTPKSTAFLTNGSLSKLHEPAQPYAI